jgi:hypothetical protein
LEDGSVIVEHIEPAEVVEIFDTPPTGYHFALCAVADDQTIFCAGNSKLEPKRLCGPKSSEWPNSCFEIVRTVRHDLFVGVFCYGAKKVPTRAYTNDPQYSMMRNIDDGDVFPGRPQGIVDQLSEIVGLKRELL